MRMTISIAAAALGLALCVGARAQDAPSTVSDYVNAMGASAQRLDVQVGERQRAGDMASAQRLVLAAAMIRRVAEEFRGAEQDNIPNKVSTLPAPTPDLVNVALAEAVKAEKSAAGQPGFLDEAQTTFAKLLSALPTANPHQVFYGMLVSDLADPRAPLPSDVLVYGFRLVDPEQKRSTTVFFGKRELPEANVVIKSDRLEITLPDDIKKAINFAPPPCDSRLSFALRFHGVYLRRRGFWPLRWVAKAETTADFFALPSPVIYAVKAIASTESVSATTASVDYSQMSDLAVAECEHTQSIEILRPLPENATDPTCTASWVDTTGATKMVSQCVIEGHNVHATGAISAGAVVCSPGKGEKLCSCTSRAQGFLQAAGRYKVLQPGGEVKSTAESTAFGFPAGSLGVGRLAVGPGEALRHAAVQISRRACNKVADTIDVSVGEDPHAAYENDSNSGVFRAVLKNGALTVGAVDAFPTELDKSP